MPPSLPPPSTPFPLQFFLFFLFLFFFFSSTPQICPRLLAADEIGLSCWLLPEVFADLLGLWGSWGLGKILLGFFF